MPATVPVDDPSVQFELTRYMEDHWVPVIEKDVDGSNSLPLALDRENPNLGRYSASRRVARTIYMGSAPTSEGREPGNRGPADQARLRPTRRDRGDIRGCPASAHRPGDLPLCGRQTVLVFDAAHGDAACRGPGRRNCSEHDVDDEIVRRLARRGRVTEAISRRSMPALPSADVPDDREARLVILGPEHPHTAKDANSTARKEAAKSLNTVAPAPGTTGTPWSFWRRCHPTEGTATRRSGSSLPGIRYGRTEKR